MKLRNTHMVTELEPVLGGHGGNLNYNCLLCKQLFYLYLLYKSTHTRMLAARILLLLVLIISYLKYIGVNLFRETYCY